MLLFARALHQTRAPARHALARFAAAPGPRDASARPADGSVAVKIEIAPALRAALKLPGKQRKTRCFVEDRADERALRDAIETKVPALRLADYALEDRNGTVVVEGAAPEPEPEPAAPRAPAAAYRMLSYYHFFGDEKTAETVDAVVRALDRDWAALGVLGRAYAAPEGLNAQLAVPDDALGAFERRHLAFFEKLEEPPPGLNLARVVGRAEFDARPPFRALHVRARAQVVADGARPRDETRCLRDESPARRGAGGSPCHWS